MFERLCISKFSRGASLRTRPARSRAAYGARPPVLNNSLRACNVVTIHASIEDGTTSNSSLLTLNALFNFFSFACVVAQIPYEDSKKLATSNNNAG